jgi:multisubunit Na+/H+ antiporter MnhC subunit
MGARLVSSEWTASGRWIPAALVALGVAARFVALGMHGVDTADAEAHNIAVDFARTGTIGNAFGHGTGPTAHLSPVMPVLAGSVYRLLGVDSMPAELLLTAISIAMAMAAALLVYHAFGRLGLGRGSRLIALAVFCLAPIDFKLEIIEFRIWEGTLAALLMSCSFWLVTYADCENATDLKSMSVIALVCAAALFVNPAAGLTSYALALALLMRRIPPQRWTRPVLIGVAAVVLVLGPWTIRNYVDFGRFIPLRSNAGLELALAYHQGLETGESDRTIFRRRMVTIHPNEAPGAEAAIRASGGEVQYADRLGKQALHWIAGHPWLAARATARHLAEFYFPPRWLYDLYSPGSGAKTVKMGVAWAISLLGLAGAAAALFRWRGQWLYGAIVALVPAIPYMFVQPILRYRYIIYTPLLFLAVAAAAAAVRQLRKWCRPNGTDVRFA